MIMPCAIRVKKWQFLKVENSGTCPLVIESQQLEGLFITCLNPE